MQVKPNSFGKQERLKSRKQIELLFQKGNSLFVHPVKVSWMLLPVEQKANSIQIGVSVSKRYFKKAADRNRIKRLLRECYRLNKHHFLSAISEKEKSLSVFFVYVDKTLPTFEFLQEKMKLCLKRLADKVNQHEKLL